MSKYTMFIGLVCTIGALGATDAIMPWITNQPQFRSSLIFNNRGATTAEVRLHAIRPGGGDTNEAMASLVLEPFSQQIISANQLFPELGDGQGFTVHLRSESDDVTGAFVVRGTGSKSGDSPAQGNVVDRSEASSVILYDYLTVRQGRGVTGLVVVNAGDAMATVELSAYQNDKRLATATVSVKPNHPFVAVTDSVFPGVAGEIYAVAASDQPLMGLAFLFNDDLEPSMANTRSIDVVPTAPDFETQVSTYLGQTASFDGFIIDQMGQIYGAGGYTNDHLVKIDANGEVSVLARGLGGPVHLIQGEAGHLFVSEFMTHTVSRVDLEGNHSVYASGLDAPTSLVFDEAGNLWVANYGQTYQGNTISKITPDGVVSTALNDPLILAPIDIAFHESGDLLIANQVGGRILRATRDGQITVIDRLPARSIGHMVYVNGLCYATSGNQIFKISLDGKREVFAGTGVPGLVDGPGSIAQFSRPNGIWPTPDKSSLLVAIGSQGSNNANVIRLISLK